LPTSPDRYMRVPDINHEACRYIDVFDNITAPFDPDRKLFGRIGAYGVLGTVIYPLFVRGIAQKVRLEKATDRYVRAARANYPNEIAEGSTFVSIRRHAGLYAGRPENHITSEQE